MTCTCLSISVSMRVALNPLGNSVVLLRALVINTYLRSARGKDSTGAALSWFCSCRNALRAASRSSLACILSPVM